MTPTIPITDPRFVYTPSHKTDIRKLFAKVRREQERGVDPLNPDTYTREKRK